MKMKKVIAILLTAVSVVGLTACGGGTSTSGDGSKAIVRVATWREYDKEYYEEVEKRFEDKYPQYDVQLEFNTDEVSYEQNIQTDLVMGTAPDVFDLHASGNIQHYGESGLILDQSDMEWINNVGAEAKETVSWDGATYAFPLNYNYFGFVYNKEIFTQVGVEVPTTPEELVAVVNKLKDAGYNGISYSGQTNGTKVIDAALLIEMGAEKYSDMLEGMDDGSVTDIKKFEGVETALKTVQYYTQNDIWYKGYRDTSYEPSLSLFAQKKTAIMFCGAYIFGEKETQMPGIDAGFFPIPTYSANGMSYAEVGQCSCINAKSENLEGAKAWVEFLGTKEISEYLCGSSRTMSTLEGAVPEFEEAEMLLASAKGYSLFKASYADNSEWYDKEWRELKEGIFYLGEEYAKHITILNNQLKEANLKDRK